MTKPSPMIERSIKPAVTLAAFLGICIVVIVVGSIWSIQSFWLV